MDAGCIEHPAITAGIEQSSIPAEIAPIWQEIRPSMAAVLESLPKDPTSTLSQGEIADSAIVMHVSTFVATSL